MKNWKYKKTSSNLKAALVNAFHDDSQSRVYKPTCPEIGVLLMMSVNAETDLLKKICPA